MRSALRERTHVRSCQPQRRLVQLLRARQLLRSAPHARERLRAASL